MLRLCSRDLWCLVKKMENADAALARFISKKIKKTNRASYYNRKGYAHFSTLKLRNCCAHTFLSSAGLKCNTSTIINTNTQFNEHTDSTKKNTGLMLAALGSLIGLMYVSHDSEKAMDFIYAAKSGNIQELKRLLQDGVNIHTKHPFGWNALHTAAINGQAKVVKFLIDKGINVDAGDEFTNVYKVAKEKLLPVSQVLQCRAEEFYSRLSADVSFKGFTALHYAVLIDSVECVQVLIDAGVDPTINNDAGYCAIDYAKEGTIQSILRKYILQYDAIKKAKDAEERRRFPLEQRLRQHIVGQEGAITLVASTIRRKENGWIDEEHPLVFLFLGSSGIGKTELAKRLAAYIHKNKSEGFIRLDMSEYQEKHEVAKLIGAPPGYIGHNSGGQLTKHLKKCPSAVVLFDEVDKAHPDVLTVLLQLFDEGRLTDGKGKTIQCKDAIFIMTSNLGNEEIAKYAMQLRAEAESIRGQRLNKNAEYDEVTVSRDFKDTVIRPILKAHFRRDEFLGRINEIIYFLPFSRSELLTLVRRELEAWAVRAKETHMIELKWENEVLLVLAEGYDLYYGARSIKYEVERRVVNQLAAAQERGQLGKGCCVFLKTKQDDNGTDIVISVKPKGFSKFVDVIETKSAVKNVSW